MKNNNLLLIKLFSVFLALLQLTACGGGGGGDSSGDGAKVPNQAPTAQIITLTTEEDQAVSIFLAGSDVDGTISAYTVATSPAHGVLRGSVPDLTYTPTLNYSGSDSFTFTVTDDAGAISTAATVSITVNAVNDLPVATEQSVILNEDVAMAITLAGSDVDGTISAYTIASGPVHGALTGTAPNLTYTPAADFFGSDSFTFTVTDDAGGISPVATASITINAVNDLPVATPQSVTLDEDVATAITLAGSDVDGTISAYTIASGPVHGILSGSAPNLTYTPTSNYAGSDSFTFTVIDNEGATSTAATVSITVNAVNDLPVATAQSVALYEGVATSITLSGSDIDGTISSYSVVTLPAHGALTGTAPSLTYTPTVSYIGSDSFTFTVTDNEGATSTAATVSITIKNINLAPTATADSFTATGNTQKTFVAPGVMANDSDIDSPAGDLTVTAGMFATTNGGSVNMSSDGSFIYTPPVGENSDSFTYTLNDNDSVNPKSTLGSVTITMSDMVWYVDDSAVGGGNGTSVAPFNNLPVGAAAASTGETVFVYAGNYLGGITLPLASQLIGEAAGLSVDGLTIPVGMAPTITAPSGIKVVNVIGGNTIKGVNIGGGEFGISGNGIVNLAVQNVKLINTGSDSISLIAPSGTVSIADSTIIATSTARADGLSIDTTDLTSTLLLSVRNTIFTGRGDLSGDGLQTAIAIDTSAAKVGVVHTSVTGSTFEKTWFGAIKIYLSGTGGDTVTIGDGITGNTFTGIGTAVMDFLAEDNTNISYSIQGNTIDGNGLSIDSAIDMEIWDGVTVSATITDNSFTNIGDDTVFDSDLYEDDMVMRFVIGDTLTAASNVSLNISNNSMVNNMARGVVIDAYGASTVGARVDNNTFDGHLGNNGLDVLTAITGTSVCLAASGNNAGTSSDEFVLEAQTGTSLNITGAVDETTLSNNNNGMAVNITGATFATCTP